jgi:hypothetical protein
LIIARICDGVIAGWGISEATRMALLLRSNTKPLGEKGGRQSADMRSTAWPSSRAQSAERAGSLPNLFRTHGFVSADHLEAVAVGNSREVSACNQLVLASGLDKTARCRDLACKTLLHAGGIGMGGSGEARSDSDQLAMLDGRDHLFGRVPIIGPGFPWSDESAAGHEPADVPGKRWPLSFERPGNLPLGNPLELAVTAQHQCIEGADKEYAGLAILAHPQRRQGQVVAGQSHPGAHGLNSPLTAHHRQRRRSSLALLDPRRVIRSTEDVPSDQVSVT